MTLNAVKKYPFMWEKQIKLIMQVWLTMNIEKHKTFKISLWKMYFADIKKWNYDNSLLNQEHNHHKSNVLKKKRKNITYTWYKKKKK